MDNSGPTVLTPWQKLQALAMRFYSRMEWPLPVLPGQYYTTSRADLELYQVVDVKDGKIYTRYCDPERGGSISIWSEEEFLSPETFGYPRVWVHPAYLEPHPYDVNYVPQKT